MQSIPGAPYVGAGMDNINEHGAVKGDWNGTLAFWNDSVAVSKFKKQYPANPFKRGMAYELYERVV